MNREPEVLVIGAGVIGVAAAHALAERGRRVTTIDAGEVGRGSSYGNAGLAVPSHAVPLANPGALRNGLKWLLDPESPFYVRLRFDPELWSWLWRFRAASNEQQVARGLTVLRDLLLAGRELFDTLTALPEMRCGYAQDGTLWVYRTRAGLAEAVEEAEMLEEVGLHVERLDEAGVQAMAGSVRPGVAGGIWFAQDGHMDPFLFVERLRARAESLGVEFAEKTECIGFETKGGRVHRVLTTKGDFDPETVVLATGSWSPAVARGLGLRLPVQPGKGYSLTYERPASCPPLPVVLGEARVVATPMGGNLRLAGTLEMVGMDESINRQRVGAIRRAANRYLTGLEDMELEETWRGLRPCTPDGLPLLGRSAKWENLIVATGHAMLGLSLAPISGEIVARLADDEETGFDLAELRPERFG